MVPLSCRERGLPTAFESTPWHFYRLNAQEEAGGVFLSGFAIFSPTVVVDTLLRQVRALNFDILRFDGFKFW